MGKRNRRKIDDWTSDDDDNDISEETFLKELVREVSASSSTSSNQRCCLCKRYKKRDMMFTPRDKVETALWATVISPKVKKPYLICQKHFSNDDFKYAADSKIQALVAGAVPLIPDELKNKDKNAGGPYADPVDPKWFCAVSKCKNHKADEFVQIASFQPRGKLERELWSLSLQTALHPKSHVCQRHFNDFYLETKTRGRVKLKEGAIPEPYTADAVSDSSDDDVPLRPTKKNVPGDKSDSDSNMEEDGLPLSKLLVKRENCGLKQESSIKVGIKLENGNPCLETENHWQTGS